MTTLDFNIFKSAVAKQIAVMFKTVEGSRGIQLFKVDVDKDKMWETYLNSFPLGTNPKFRERTEYDCSACRAFIKNFGNVVMIDSQNMNGVITIWDAEISEPTFQTVSHAMANLIRSHGIRNVYLSAESTAGVDKSLERIINNGKEQVLTWQHFFTNIPQKYVVRKADIGSKLGEYQATRSVFLRSLTELTLDSIDTVLDLIAQGSLYRGAEFTGMLTSFRNEKVAFDKLSQTSREYYAWLRFQEVAAVAKIRNSAIGTLLIDLSTDVDLEEAVRKFEAVMAPANYKRPTALVTPKMLEAARAKIEELGLSSALPVRHAQLDDLSVNDILFVDNEARPQLLDGDVFDEIAAKLTDSNKKRNMDNVQEVPIEKFLSDILPTAKTLEVMLENKHQGNLVNILAPQDPTAGRLFKWGNNFRWAYAGGVADAIKARVKAAGGNVTGDLCCRLAWYNFDDLDLHMREPDGNKIYFSSKVSNRTGGRLDVDMNAGGGQTREPVENIFYTNKAKMTEGIYELIVNQFNQRERDNVGFEAQIDFMGDVYHFHYDKPIADKTNILVAKFRYSHTKGIEILESLPHSTQSKDIWGLASQKFHPVSLMMLSPNHWESSGSGVGNKHYMFMLKDCINPDPARGFFNEFLKEDLNEHRKVFEMVGAKVRAEGDNQLAGLGFSSTQRAELLVRVTGSFNRTLKIKF